MQLFRNTATTQIDKTASFTKYGGITHIQSLSPVQTDTMTDLEKMISSGSLKTHVGRSLREEEDFHFLRFEYLQRLNLTNLHITLAHQKSKLEEDGLSSEEEGENLKKLLRDYATAIRDYRYLRSSKAVPAAKISERKTLLEANLSFKDGSPISFASHYHFFEDETAQIDPLRRSLMASLPKVLTFSREEKRQRSKEYQDGNPPHQVSTFVDGLARFLIALTGGAFLIGPMIIMALGPSLYKNLTV
ncbi:hypothetical protein BN1708_003838, partial [Verticillium longisporum]